MEGSAGNAIDGGLHSFLVPAYGKSPHLRDCLDSLARQTLPSPVIVCTSTPFDGMEAICEEFKASLVCHGPNIGIGHDWNAALRQARSGWVTLAHQDDVYHPRFAEKSMAAVGRHPDAVLTFTDYGEVDDNGARPGTVALRIKRILIESGMLGRECASGRWSKTNMLRFGCSIACPTVSLRVEAIPEDARFDERYRVNLDWDFWLRLANEVPGGFLYIREVLMHHRIHIGSETTAAIVDGVRAAEDLELFSRMWPRPLAILLARAYRLSYSFNRS